MTKSELKNGMVVEIRNGNIYLVVGDKVIRAESFINLSNYNNDLNACGGINSLDIVKVYDADEVATLNDVIEKRTDRFNLIWQRVEDNIAVGDIYFDPTCGTIMLVYDVVDNDGTRYYCILELDNYDHCEYCQMCEAYEFNNCKFIKHEESLSNAFQVIIKALRRNYEQI